MKVTCLAYFMNIYEKLQQKFKSKFKIYSRVNQLFHEILYNKFRIHY
jgi:hypothetical protein